jgi:multiple sugar transport system permease protein
MRTATRNTVFLHVAAVLVSLAILAPFVWMVLASVSPQKDLVAVPYGWIPQQFYFDRYIAIFGSSGIGNDFRAALLNTLIVALATVAISLTVGIFGAYAFARLEFKLRRATLMTFLGTYMLPQIALLIPLYLMLTALRLLDTTVGLIVVNCSLVIPFTLWILSNYLIGIPKELEEAARIDGTSRIGALFRVILPVAKPGIFAAGMFGFLMAWDEFMYALVFTSSNASKTLPVAIAEFSGRYTTDFGLVAAGGLLAALPPVILAIIFQKYVVNGMAAGSVKG